MLEAGHGMTPPLVDGRIAPEILAAARFCGVTRVFCVGGAQAIELDDSSAGAHAALALAKTLADWDWAGAEAEWRRALELDPAYAKAHYNLGSALAAEGRAAEAERHFRRAVELDPRPRPRRAGR